MTDVGRGWIVDKLDSTVTTLQNRIGWGTGAGTAAIDQTTLFTEAAETRATGVQSQPTTTLARVVGTLTCAGSGKTITNAGLFDAATAGVLLIKGDFTGVPLLVGDSIEFTFELQVNAG